MKNEIINVDSVALKTNDSMPITSQDLDFLAEKRKLLKEFVSKQLVQGDDSDGDYAVITGCKKPSLLKPGAEKLMQLFGLGSRVSLTFKEIDHNGNFAMFVYKAEVYHLRTGVVICECEGSANSKEKKWATRPEWVDGVKKTVETPIYDVLNTLMKMAQKRAEVGCVVKATGASDFFTQDIDSDEDATQNNIKPEVKNQSKSTPGLLLVKGDTHPHKDFIKSLGGKWDMNNKCWSIMNASDETKEKIMALKGVEVA